MFRHGLLREAAYGHLLPNERARAHAATADALEASSQRVASPRSRPKARWPSTDTPPTRSPRRSRRPSAPDSPPIGSAHAKPSTTSNVHWSCGTGFPTQTLSVASRSPICYGCWPRSAEEHGEFDRADRYILAAIAALEEGGDPLLASRVYASYGAHYKEFRGGLDQREALDQR